MGEHPDHVFNVGCPSGDYIIPMDANLSADTLQTLGVGGIIDVNNPFFLVIFHPITTDFVNQREQAMQLINALHEMAHPTIWIWPNVDAGSDCISKALRAYREHNNASWLRLVKNLDPVTYQKTLKRAACAIGNSSSFVRDSTFSGTPVVLVGDRQVGREHGENVLSCSPISADIVSAIRKQLKLGRRNPSNLYGDGNASRKIVQILKTFRPYAQKKLHYPLSNDNTNY